MQSCSRCVLSFYFKISKVLLCQNNDKSKIVWFEKCDWVQFSVKFRDLEVQSFTTNNNEFFPPVFQGFWQNNNLF